MAAQYSGVKDKVANKRTPERSKTLLLPNREAMNTRERVRERESEKERKEREREQERERDSYEGRGAR